MPWISSYKRRNLRNLDTRFCDKILEFQVPTYCKGLHSQPRCPQDTSHSISIKNYRFVEYLIPERCLDFVLHKCWFVFITLISSLTYIGVFQLILGTKILHVKDLLLRACYISVQFGFINFSLNPKFFVWFENFDHPCKMFFFFGLLYKSSICAKSAFVGLEICAKSA